ncbi:unnamed protein product [Prunus armeniaca]
MSDMEEVLERQEREIRERRRRRAASKRAQRDLDQQLVMAVAMLDKENQSSRGSHEGRAPNVDRHRHSRGKNLMEAVIQMLAYGASADQVDEIARMGKSTALESLVRFCDAVETLGAARMFDEEVLRSIMITCIILHNMIVEDEYDYEAEEVYEPDPMNTALTRIYEKPIGPNGEPVEHEPLVRDGLFMNRMIDRYTEMQSLYIHERHQVDLMEHLWAVKGNDGE